MILYSNYSTLFHTHSIGHSNLLYSVMRFFGLGTSTPQYDGLISSGNYSSEVILCCGGGKQDLHS